MTLSNILNASKTSLYLTGRYAYVREFDICTRAAKADFESLLNNRESAIIHINNNTAAKYMRRVYRLGFTLKGLADYGNGESVAYVERIRYASFC